MLKTIALALGALTVGACAAPKVAEVFIEGDQKTLRERDDDARQSAPETPPLLFLALDGMSRDLLYDMLRKGELPNLAALLGGDDLKHAYLDETVLSTLPSSTFAAWATMMTGKTPAEHGVTGNEYFVRRTATFACPAPVSFEDSAPTFEIYSDDYMNSLVDAPTVYEQMKTISPASQIWVAMHSVYRGADRLLMARRTVVSEAFEAFLITQIKKLSEGRAARDTFAGLDEEVLDVVSNKLKDEANPVPDVLTIYLSGTDLYAHVAAEGPDQARRAYLKEVVDPQLKELVEALRKRNALDNRWVVLSSDHGHTEVEEMNHIDTEGPKRMLEHLDFRVRPFMKEVDDDEPYSAVLAWGGAMAYVYVADRSACDKKGRCNWQLPARYEEDTLAAAEGFYQANRIGTFARELHGRLDMILVREGKPVDEIDNPFSVYIGNGKTQSIRDYLAAHPHPTYVEMEARLRDLAVGKHGEHAGDILLIANNGNMKTPGERYYFSHAYKSWHGSPSKEDGQIPLIVANAGRSKHQIEAWVKARLGERPSQQNIAKVLVGLRKDPPGADRVAKPDQATPSKQQRQAKN